MCNKRLDEASISIHKQHGLEEFHFEVPRPQAFENEDFYQTAGCLFSILGRLFKEDPQIRDNTSPDFTEDIWHKLFEEHEDTTLQELVDHYINLLNVNNHGATSLQEKIRMLGMFYTQQPHELHRDYMTLFIGPYAPPVPAWASCFTSPDHAITGRIYLELKEKLRTWGVHYQAEASREPEDHIATLLLLCGTLLLSAAHHQHCAQPNQARRAIEHAHELIGVFIMPWFSRYVSMLEETYNAATHESVLFTSAYVRLAQIAHEVLKLWVARFEMCVVQRNLYL